VVADLDIVVLADQKRENVDIVGLGLRPVHQPAGAGALTQRIVDLFRIVGKHAEGAIAAHHRARPGKALHQDRGDFLLAGRGVVVGPVGGQLVDIVDGAEADDALVHDIGDELFAVLSGLALIGRDLVDAEILVMERIARDLAIIVDQAGDHLDQRGLAGSRKPVADEGEQEPAEIDERVQLPVEIVGHQHLGDLQRLIFGNVVADHLVRFLEGHDQRLAAGGTRCVETVEAEIVGVDADMHAVEHGKAGEALLAGEQRLDGRRRHCANVGDQGLVVPDALDRLVEAIEKSLVGFARRVEFEHRFRTVLGRLGARQQGAGQIARGGEQGDEGFRVEKLVILGGALALQRRGPVFRLHRL